MKYYIDYGTGEDNEWVDGNLQEAMDIADEGARYTQENFGVYLYDEGTYVPVAVRNWYGVAYNADDEALYAEDPIVFGTEGFYGDWQTEF